MKGDKRQGGKLAIAAKGFNATYEASIGDIHYTLMCYTAATGEPVMVVVIFAASGDKIESTWVTYARKAVESAVYHSYLPKWKSILCLR